MLVRLAICHIPMNTLVGFGPMEMMVPAAEIGVICCIEIGPLFCCNQHEDWYCSTQITPIVAANKLAVYINLYEMCF